MDILEAIRILRVPRPIPQGSYTSPHEALRYEAEWQLRQEAEEVCWRYQTYLPLTAEEGHAVALAALDLFDKERDRPFQSLPHYVLENLARAVPGALQGLYPHLIERNLFWGNGVLYREADPGTRDLLLAHLKTARQDVVKYRDLLCALAWIGDETVQQVLKTLKHKPPAWTGVTSLRNYGHFAGWEFGEDGRRRSLCFDQCYSLTFVEAESSSKEDGPVAVMAPHEETCPWCERPLMTLFDLHLRDSRLAFLPIQGERFRIPICLDCSFQAALFFENEDDGTTHWCENNGKPPAGLRHSRDDHVPRWPQKQYILAERRKTPYIARGSHLGGQPDWVQFPDYPHCPTCRQTMLFVGQLDPSMDSGAPPVLDGVIYAFLCPSCRNVIAKYQQT